MANQLPTNLPSRPMAAIERRRRRRSRRGNNSAAASEALLAWNDLGLGNISPSTVLTILDEAGTSATVGHHGRGL